MISPKYRWSHQDSGHGVRYDRMYGRAYYRQLWHDVERPLVGTYLKAIAKDVGDELLVDIACGTGRVTVVGANDFSSVVGVDISEDMLELARRHEGEYANLAFEQLDLESPTAVAKFRERRGPASCVTAFRLFTNADPDLRVTAANVAFRLLGDEGALIANTHMTPTSPTGSIYRAERWVRTRLGRSQRMFNKLLDPADLRDLFLAAGFTNVEIRRYGAFPGLPKLWKWTPDGWVAKVEDHFSGRVWNQCALVIARKQ